VEGSEVSLLLRCTIERLPAAVGDEGGGGGGGAGRMYQTLTDTFERQLHVEGLQDGGDFGRFEYRQQQVLGADVVMAHASGDLLGGQEEVVFVVHGGRTSSQWSGISQPTRSTDARVRRCALGRWRSRAGDLATIVPRG